MYVVFNKRSKRAISQHGSPEDAAAEIVKAGAWTRWAIRRDDGEELGGAELHAINRVLYPALHEKETDDDRARVGEINEDGLTYMGEGEWRREP